MIDKNFYNQVEKPGFLKHILYGDSIAEHHKIVCKINNQLFNLSFKDLWNQLIKNQTIENIDNKEYIFNPNLEILNYDIKNDQIIYTKPKYLMRHFFNGKCIKNNFLNQNLVTTQNHSFVDIKNNIFIPIYAKDVQYVLNENLIKFKINSKELIDYSGYVYDFEVPKTHTFIVEGIIVHNTDSLFIQIPDKSSKTIYDKIRKMNKVLIDINDLIADYTKKELMPRCGFDPKYCETNFKGEMLIDTILFIDVKKSYAYRQIAAEADVNDKNEIISGKILDPPEITKRSTLGVKGDMIQLTKDIMQDIIDISFLNIPAHNKYKLINEKIGGHYKKFTDAIKALDIKTVGFPARWQKKIYVNNSMKLYNKIIEPVFQYLSFGYAVYCNFSSLQTFKNLDLDFPIEKVKMMVFPPKFDVNLVKQKMDEYGITLNPEEQWNKVYNVVCHRLMDNIKRMD